MCVCWGEGGRNWSVPLGYCYTPINVGRIEGFHLGHFTHPSMLGELKGSTGVLLHTHQCWGNWKVTSGYSYTCINVGEIEGSHLGYLTHPSVFGELKGSTGVVWHMFWTGLDHKPDYYKWNLKRLCRETSAMDAFMNDLHDLWYHRISFCFYSAAGVPLYTVSFFSVFSVVFSTSSEIYENQFVIFFSFDCVHVICWHYLLMCHILYIHSL